MGAIPRNNGVDAHHKWHAPSHTADAARRHPVAVGVRPDVHCAPAYVFCPADMQGYVQCRILIIVIMSEAQGGESGEIGTDRGSADRNFQSRHRDVCSNVPGYFRPFTRDHVLGKRSFAVSHRRVEPYEIGASHVTRRARSLRTGPWPCPAALPLTIQARSRRRYPRGTRGPRSAG